MQSYPSRRHLDVLDDLVTVAQHRVLDIGCGDGALVRALTKRGAHCVGVEVTPERIAQAEARDKLGDEVYLEASGSKLPLPDESMDLVIFFNALHHLPPDDMSYSLQECHRLLKPEGYLYVAEPLAQGPLHELTRSIDDETELRQLAYQALCAAGDGPGLTQLQEVFYQTVVSYKNFGDFRKKMEEVSPRRQAIFRAQEALLVEAFERLGRPGIKGQEFDNPMRVNLLQRRA
jgi:ubiquinone/menaquinone biosynthesis C-methylase UbiE